MKLRKVFAATLAAIMVVAAPMTAMADLVTEDATLNQVADGTSGWNSGGTGVTFPIDANGVTVVFANDAFTRDTSNWSNFVFETIASDKADGWTGRADAYAWTYESVTGTKVNTPTHVVETSWADDWSGFAALTDSTDVTLNAKKTDANTVVYTITFASDASAWEKYTVTYPDGVPADLSFQIGADGGKVTLKSVDFPETASENPDIAAKGDMSTVMTFAVLFVGAALVVVASKKRFA